MPELIRGQYEVLEEIGKGGMGQVLKARDIKLNRTVALKVLRAEKVAGATTPGVPSSAADEERRRRFFNEAQTASALNHPNIVTIYDIVSEGPHDYLVMEFIQGKTLAEILAEKPMDYKEVLAAAVQMADALTAAHSAHIVHRDMKPGNVMLTSRGLVKILDFGLAKIGAPLDDPHDPDATQLTPVTREGFILGTCAYMSPEQAQGKTVDARSDIFSFGAVLYEMATGRRAFSGDNNITTLSAVLRDEPKSLLELSPNIPTALERLIHRCLRKDPAERWQSMEEVLAALSALKRSADSGLLNQKRYGPSAAFSLPTSDETIAMAAPPPPDPPPPPPNASPAASWLNNPRYLLFAAIVAAVLFGPFQDFNEGRRGTKSFKVEVSGDVSEAIATAKRELEKLKAPRERVTNEDILKMVEEKVPEDVILGHIRDGEADFSLESDDVIALTKAGVSAAIIEGMRNPSAIPPKLAGPPPKGTTPLTLPDGHEVKLQLAADLTEGPAIGTPLAFTVAEDVKVGEVVVVPRGAPAHGIVAMLGRKRGSRPARVGYRLTGMESMGGRTIALRASAKKKDPPKDYEEMERGADRERRLVSRMGTEFTAYVNGEQMVFAPTRRPGPPTGDRPAVAPPPAPERKAPPAPPQPVSPPANSKE
ncbi:MAG: hypothetical protein OHK0021_08960 [Bryobacter sp.]